MTEVRFATTTSRQVGWRASATWRAVCVVAMVLTALVLQVSVVPLLAPLDVKPNLALLIVVATALARGRDFAALLGFVLGLALDLSPAADQLAGRWALALVIVGYVVGSTHAERRDSNRLVLLVIALGASFVGTSIFALTGVLLSDPATAVPEVLQMIVTSSLSDGLVGVLLLPWCIGVFASLAQPVA